jgi:preprotein translocase subunit YajC
MMCLISMLSMIAMATPPGNGQGASQGSWMTSLVPLIVIFGIFYFLMIRPQQKQQKKHREMLSSLKKGDQVVTRGGIMGTVYGIADTIVTVEVAENIRIKFSRDAISGVQATNS